MVKSYQSGFCVPSNTKWLWLFLTENTVYLNDWSRWWSSRKSRGQMEKQQPPSCPLGPHGYWTCPTSVAGHPNSQTPNPPPWFCCLWPWPTPSESGHEPMPWPPGIRDRTHLLLQEWEAALYGDSCLNFSYHLFRPNVWWWWWCWWW